MDPVRIFQTACQTGKCYILEKLLEADLFDANCLIETKSGVCAPALMYAIKYGTTQIVKLLIEEGARVNEHSRDVYGGKTPLIFAILLMDLDKIKILLHYGADITYEDSERKSALYYALRTIYTNEKLAKEILNCGCNLPGESKFVVRYRTFCRIFKAVDERNVRYLAECLGTISDFELDRVENEITPLHYALNCNIFEAIDIYAKRNIQYVAFKIINHFSYSYNGFFIYLLENHKLDVNIRDEKGRTFLHLSQKYAYRFAFFLELGTDPMIASEDRKKPKLDCEGRDGRSCPVAKYYLKLNLIDENFVESETNSIFDEDFWDSYIDASPEATVNYMKEIEVLKSIQISQSTSISPAISLFEYLYLKPNKVYKYALNTNLQKLYKESKKDFSNEFPYYGFIINYQYRRELTRKHLLESAANLLILAFGSIESMEITEEIFQYLSDKALKKLII